MVPRKYWTYVIYHKTEYWTFSGRQYSVGKQPSWYSGIVWKDLLVTGRRSTLRIFHATTRHPALVSHVLWICVPVQACIQGAFD